MTGGRWGRKKNYAPWIRAVCLLSGLNSRSGGGHVYSLAGRDGILWCESRFKFRSEDRKQKKGLQREILGFVLSFTYVFWSKTRLYSHLREHKQYFGRYRPRNALEWHQACYFFLGTILAWGNTFLAWRGTFLAWGAPAPKCLPWRQTCFPTPIKTLVSVNSH